jgi:tRNA (cytidine56-2'-O)-methyltransferase
MLLSGDNDQQLVKSIGKVAANWGGSFTIKYVRSWRSFLNGWKSGGKIVHLTMYGEDVRRIIGEIRASNSDLAIIVGSQKVPRELYEIADWNVSITNQPHSEVSALAVFLHMLTEGNELDLEFKQAKLHVIPSRREKQVIAAVPRHPSS